MHKGWCVYIAYDAAGLPLYIGQTVDIRSRMRSHERRSVWYSIHVAVVRFPVLNETVAHTVERELIMWHHPRFNSKQMPRVSYWGSTGERLVALPRYASRFNGREFEKRQKRLARFLWLCDIDPRVLDVPEEVRAPREGKIPWIL